ncbi:sigma-70 family RNA polymerase sigma factor [Neobacillus sp. MM2021_6]|uniref:sigma-70 family RNA polymerase sigma factor n=1 Tax=Bacillaceae TaxID=186817 RepID=UPI001408F489|nr:MULTISPECIES: sigma-70 family RNA polymerase sigma factor [Bacillaceae]MBO0961993.1 sigma-70 family RNA polymerase sigma factor [Neobacillus sp. MM2021_6]NHC20311.1 sigma-70 family RNA polymerase sigma factor [Bacillus sp. MM2020_4]
MVLIRWDLATNNQLWTIIESDWDIPYLHIEGLVTEALNRNLFDHLIKHLINKMFPRWENERRYHYYDLYSIGYIGVVQALKNYKIGKGSFKTFAYINIKSEFSHHINKIKTDKRKHYETMVSLDVQKHDENEESFLESLVDKSQDPEKIVLNKLFWEGEFRKVSENEKEVLLLFSQGFSMNEIAKIKGYKGAAFISRLFHRAIKKINPQAEKMNVKHSGLMTVTKLA